MWRNILFLFVAINVQAQTTFEVEQEVFALINKHRVSLGMNALIQSDIIVRESRKHSANMASGKVRYSHAGFKQRTSTIRRVTHCGLMAENITYVSSREVAANAVRSWLNSKGHRENIENPGFSVSGVGVAKNRYGEFYLTQIFGVK